MESRPSGELGPRRLHPGFGPAIRSDDREIPGRCAQKRRLTDPIRRVARAPPRSWGERTGARNGSVAHGPSIATVAVADARGASDGAVTAARSLVGPATPVQASQRAAAA